MHGKNQGESMLTVFSPWARRHVSLASANLYEWKDLLSLLHNSSQMITYLVMFNLCLMI